MDLQLMIISGVLLVLIVALFIYFRKQIKDVTDRSVSQEQRLVGIMRFLSGGPPSRTPDPIGRREFDELPKEGFQKPAKKETPKEPQRNTLGSMLGTFMTAAPTLFEQAPSEEEILEVDDEEDDDGEEILEVDKKKSQRESRKET
jgi:hypothetical protein